MRRHTDKNGLIVNAIAGTHVVFFGLDLAEAQRPGFRGFGFKRLDHVEGETTWLRGMKTFEKTLQPLCLSGSGQMVHGKAKEEHPGVVAAAILDR